MKLSCFFIQNKQAVLQVKEQGLFKLVQKHSISHFHPAQCFLPTIKSGDIESFRFQRWLMVLRLYEGERGRK